MSATERAYALSALERSALDDPELDEGEIDEIWQVESPAIAEAKKKREEQAVWRANPGPQSDFLSLTCYEILYGGAAGGGKSEALIVQPSRWFDADGFYSITLRRDTPQLLDLLRKGMRIYGKRPKLTPFIHWEFNERSLVRFGHCQNEGDATRYQGQEINLLCLDELTHFTRPQFDELRTRIRSSDPRLPKRGRYTTNPGGTGHEWVFKHWEPWLNPEFPTSALLPERRDTQGNLVPPALPGQVLYYLAGSDGEHIVPKGTPKAQGRCFIPATLEDNPKLFENDPDYEQRLLSQNDQVRVKQLRYGDWLARYAPGLLFKRGMFEIVPAAPTAAVFIRFWDRAGTEEKITGGKSGDPDWTVGTLYAYDGVNFTVCDVVRERFNPAMVFNTIAATAAADREKYGEAYIIGLSQDPGSAGKFEVAAYQSAFPGYMVEIVIETGDKVTRAGPVSTQAAAGNIRLVAGRWTSEWYNELEAFPSKGVHDDQVDSLSGAHTIATSSPLVQQILAGRGSRRNLGGLLR